MVKMVLVQLSTERQQEVHAGDAERQQIAVSV